MNEKKLRLGLVGKDVSKSKSEDIHTFILGELGVVCEYERFSVSADEFDSVMRRLMGDFDGFNVTIPYKRDVMGYLDEVAGDALDFGAVNTVVTASATGYNTDGVGFLQMVEAAGISVAQKKHRSIVAHQIPVAFVGVKFNRKAADIPFRIGCAAKTCHGGKADKNFGNFADLVE